MKPAVDSTGCATRLGRNDSAIHVTHTDDAGVTMKWSLCGPCLIRFHRHAAFAERFETIASLLKESIRCMSAQEIRLSGALGRMCGRRHFVHLDSKTSAEANRWLITQFPEARRYLAHTKEHGIVFAVFRGKHRENIGVAHINEPGGKVICFAPVIAGSKRAGAFQIIVGAILIAISLIPGFQSALPVGIGLVAGGVVQMLTKIFPV